jgi:hypothetical protein
MSATHAQVARILADKAGPGVFARAAQDAVIRNDFSTLERMFPGMRFAHRKVGQDQWELAGTAADGSVCLWGVGA